MKKTSVILILTVVISAAFFQSCKKDDVQPTPQQENIMPERFGVDIPGALSAQSMYKDANVDTLQGNDIYSHLRTFIFLGENAAETIGEIILTIAWFNLSQPVTFTYTGNDDGRLKQVVIIEDATFEGTQWEYKMTITDIGDSGDENESTAMQIFWNKSPIEGVAMLNPYNIDRTTDPKYQETMMRLDYSETGKMGYTRQMVVAVDEWPLEDPLVNPFSISTLKMFVGKEGDLVSIYGNSEHPNATFFTGETGFDWAFVGSAKDSENIGVAEVGLPSNTLNSSDRYELLVENSIKNVFTEQIYNVWPWIDTTSVQSFLYNTEAPGFFAQGGFVQGGTAPGPQYNDLVDLINGLTPYNPAEIHDLSIDFD
ncbi:MAG: hypothetical protein ACLFPE_08430 [Bacteroidales bacterium]